jgi:cytidine kinase
MPLLVVGTVALDSVITPTATRERILGGSATYFSYAASYFTPVKLVGVVGEDWPDEHTQLLKSRNIDTAGLTIVQGKKTFYWRGKYMPNMNDRETLEVHLNVFGEFDPLLPENFRDAPYIFLANGAPTIQMKTLSQCRKPKLVMADTMDLWIKETHDELLQLLKKIDGLVLNDSEAKLLTQEENLVKAGQRVLAMGPKFVILKKGEHGAMFFSKDDAFVLPAYPTDNVVDPTGAGDSFAGGIMGYLAHKDELTPARLKEAIAYGTLVASYNVEDFSLDRMKQIERKHLDERFASYKKMLAI